MTAFRMERMAGNVGYLQLNSFPPPEVAGDTAAAAMAFLASSDAVIVDLRLNSGGTGNMVNFLHSYFFDESALMTHTYRRPTNRTTENWTLGYVPGKRMGKTPLYVLTSAATFSAAEAFAAPLQAVKRAVIVGEVTRGGANPGRMRRVDDTFDVFIPIGTTKVAANDTSWDGKGITPDVATAADDALPAAHHAAVPRVISATGDQLHQSVDNGPRRRLLPVDAATFLVEGAEWVRLRFEPSKLIVDSSAEPVRRSRG